MTDYAKYRVLEIIPGALVWTTLLGAIALSFFAPLAAMVFIIIFDLYWLVRLLYLELFLIVGFRRHRKALKTDWRQKLLTQTHWQDIIHIIILPTYKESFEVLDSSLNSLIQSDYPEKIRSFRVILAGEEADKEHFLSIADRLKEKYGDVFSRLYVTVHPKGIPGELPGKGSNEAYAMRQVLIDLQQEGVPNDRVLVSTFDADTQVHPKFFSYVTYTFLTHPRRLRASYQPLPIFNNNVWDAPSFARVVSYSTTFWMMTEQVRPERLFTFSSHVMPLQALIDVGFWQTDIVTEDSRICLQAMQHYDGAYEVVPLYLPVSMDVVMGRSVWETIKNQYVQQRRWAYGVENFPFMWWNFIPNIQMPRAKKFRYIWNQLEGVYSWATAPILMLLLGRLPLWLLDEADRQAPVALNTPHILQIIMFLSLGGIIVSAIIGTTILPPRPKDVPLCRYAYMLLQWPLIIVSLIVFGSLPAIDAQTRLMFGKYLGFDVTKKFRVTRS